MAASDLTSVAFIYKKLYSQRQVGDLAERDHPFYSMVRKEDGFTGSNFLYGIRYGNPQGIGGGFSTQQTNAASSKGVQPSASRIKKYGVITLDGEAIAASRDDKGAFLKLVKTETDGVLQEFGDHLAFELYRDKSGVRGRRSSASTNAITLTIADDARNFKVGMTVGACTGSDGTSARTGTTTVAAVDEDAGIVTLTSAAGITSFADNDYLFVSGDQTLGLTGLAKHLPLTAPASGDSFNGIDRSVDTRRLAGVRVNDTSTSIEENLHLVATKISQVGKKADSAFLNPINWANVSKRLNSKVEYEGGGGEATYGFEYITVATAAGRLKVYSDPDCPTNRGYVLRMDTWYVKHLLGFPHIIMDDDLRSLRQATSDGIEIRVRSMGDLICEEPGANGCFAI